MVHLYPRRYLLASVLIGTLVAPATGLSVCGDSVLVAGEVCDDGNIVSGDFVTETVVCGNFERFKTNGFSV